MVSWLAHLPFTSEAAGSSLSENFLNAFSIAAAARSLEATEQGC